MNKTTVTPLQAGRRLVRAARQAYAEKRCTPVVEECLNYYDEVPESDFLGAAFLVLNPDDEGETQDADDAVAWLMKYLNGLDPRTISLVQSAWDKEDVLGMSRTDRELYDLVRAFSDEMIPLEEDEEDDEEDEVEVGELIDAPDPW